MELHLMNATTKIALGVVFALGAVYLLLLNVAVLSGPWINNVVLFGAGIDGRDWMWTPVLFWAFIPTVMLLFMSGLGVWVTFKYRQKKTSSYYSEASAAAQSADVHTLTPASARENQQPERPSRKAS